MTARSQSVVGALCFLAAVLVVGTVASDKHNPTLGFEIESDFVRSPPSDQERLLMDASGKGEHTMADLLAAAKNDKESEAGIFDDESELLKTKAPLSNIEKEMQLKQIGGTGARDVDQHIMATALDKLGLSNPKDVQDVEKIKRERLRKSLLRQREKVSMELNRATTTMKLVDSKKVFRDDLYCERLSDEDEDMSTTSWWAPAAVTNTQRLLEAPYTMPDRRIEINLKTGEVFNTLVPEVKDLDLFQNIFDPVKSPLTEALKNEDATKFLWVLTYDWIFIIAPETEVPFAYGDDFPDSTRALKHGDLVPLKVSDDLSNFPLNPTKICDRQKVLDGGSAEDEENWEVWCLAASRDFIAGEREGVELAPPGAKGNHFEGQCRGPARQAGELYWVTYDDLKVVFGEWPEVVELPDDIFIALAPYDATDLSLKTGRWVMDSNSSYMFQRSSTMSLKFKGASGKSLSFIHVQMLNCLLGRKGINNRDLMVNRFEDDDPEDVIKSTKYHHPKIDESFEGNGEKLIKPSSFRGSFDYDFDDSFDDNFDDSIARFDDTAKGG